MGQPICLESSSVSILSPFFSTITTHRQLVKLDRGVMLIDTPGMRELGMWDVSVGLGSAFSDVEQYLGRCKFSDCKHQTEPGCAIKAAIESYKLLCQVSHIDERHCRIHIDNRRFVVS
mgnify:CR=1 FL=1